MGQSRPLFVYFRSLLVTISIQIEKSVDGVLGIQNRGRRMVCADKTTELWRPLLSHVFLHISLLYSNWQQIQTKIEQFETSPKEHKFQSCNETDRLNFTKQDYLIFAVKYNCKTATSVASMCKSKSIVYTVKSSVTLHQWMYTSADYNTTSLRWA